MFHPVSASYLTAFEANAGKIGRIENDVLRRQIIRTYVDFKSLFDTIRLNNHFVERMQHAEALHRATPRHGLAVRARPSFCALSRPVDFGDPWRRLEGFRPLIAPL